MKAEDHFQRMQDRLIKLQAILAAVKAYPYIPQGLMALIEKMEKEAQ